MVNSRLEELHRAWEERHSTRHTEWVSTYNEAPPDDRIVEVWVIDRDGSSRFGLQARYLREDYTRGNWVTPQYSFRDWNVVAWKDVN